MSRYIPQQKYKYDASKEAKKYCNLTKFYKVLPKLRKDIQTTLTNFNYSKEHIIYLILSIIDICNFRIGNEKYKKSTGTATLKVNHIQPCHNSINVSFIGKRNVLNECDIISKKINTILMNMTEYKDDNDFIFTYIGLDKIEHKITAEDVNNFLKNYGDISTKMFRTWKANYHFIKNIKKLEIPFSEIQIKRNISKAIELTAFKLHHTKNICRRSYIDNRIITMYKESPLDFLEKISNFKSKNSYLLNGEDTLMKILNEQC